MISPEIIERLKRERDEERPALRLPLPDEPRREIEAEDDEERTGRVIVIDLI